MLDNNAYKTAETQHYLIFELNNEVECKKFTLKTQCWSGVQQLIGSCMLNFI